MWSLARVINCSILLAAAIGSVWLLMVTKQNEKPSYTDNTKKITAYMHTVEFTQTDLTGHITRTLKAPVVHQFGKKSFFNVVNPHFVLHSKKGEPVHITANTAKLAQDDKQIKLYGNVRIVRFDKSKQPNLTILTEYLEILPHQNLAVTDKPVVIKRPPNVVIHAVGLKADLKTQSVKLLSKVRGDYAPAT